ncbi:MAG: YafY family protein [Oscillospiraceae bacterium]
MQINRLFEMIYILLDKKNVTASKLAEHFEVSTRTIYRDVEVLSTAGIPIYMTKGKGGGISLLPDFVLNKTVLTEDEKQNILSSLKAVNEVSLSETDTALEKLSTLFGNNNANWIEVDFSSWSNSNEEKSVFNALKSAILLKNVAEFSYSNSKGEQTFRRVEPLKLCFKGQNWYLFGYCKTKEDFRFFKLRRVKNLLISEETFLRNSPKKVFEKAKPFDGKVVKLKLKFCKEMAYRVYDEFENFEKTADGGFIGELEMPKGEWLWGYISSFGDKCEILSPPEIRLEMKEKIEKLLKNYL